MEKIRTVVVEDEFVIAEDIQSRLGLAGYEVIGAFDRAEAALPFIVQNKPDIILVDIQLAGIQDGIHLVEEVRKNFSLPVIYITANSDIVTYERAKNTRPHAFLVKPFTPANLLAAIDLALYHFSNQTSPDQIERAEAKGHEVHPFAINNCLFIRTNGKYKKVSCEDMLFVEAAGSYVHIQTKNERFTLSQNLSHFQKSAPLPNLARIHRSYMINIDRVDSFEESFVYIKDHKLPLSENYRAEFLSKVRCL
jgi:DNA-binding LytR/AlgR family response regulator